MEKNEQTLSGRQKKYLRGLGHALQAKIIVGKEGLAENVVQAIEDALQANELLKIKLGPNCPVLKKTAADELAGQTGSTLVQLIGKTVLLYRANPERKEKERIALPK